MMGCGDSLGQVKAGFESDMLLLDANPFENVTILNSCRFHRTQVVCGKWKEKLLQSKVA